MTCLTRWRTLSGGEQARLALAILALQEANFLLLDEPTNHLDIPAQETLQSALELFGGTILLVSHDRYLINRLASTDLGSARRPSAGLSRWLQGLSGRARPGSANRQGGKAAQAAVDRRRIWPEDKG